MSGSTNTSVTWSVDGVSGGNSNTGTVSSSGTYTAPSVSGSHTVTATSVPGSSSYPHAILGGGKDGNIFVINRDSMAGFSDSANNVLQTVHTGTQQYDNIFSTPVCWNGNIYLHPNADVMHAFSWNAGPDAGRQLSSNPTSSGSTVFNMHGATPSLSANGDNNAIIWEIDNSAYVGTDPSTSGPALLHALDATNVANEL